MRHHLEPARELRPGGKVGDVAGRKILDETIGAAAGQIELRAEHDVLEAGHLVRSEGERALGAHLHAGPAIVVVGGGHHGDAGHVEVELGEIGHRRHRQADVVHLASRRQATGMASASGTLRPRAHQARGAHSPGRPRGEAFNSMSGTSVQPGGGSLGPLRRTQNRRSERLWREN